MKTLKVIFGTLFALSLVSGCGYLIYVFFGITYLPKALSILVMVLCGIGIYATIHIWSIFISSLKKDKRRAENYRDNQYK